MSAGADILVVVSMIIGIAYGFKSLIDTDAVILSILLGFIVWGVSLAVFALIFVIVLGSTLPTKTVVAGIQNVYSLNDDLEAEDNTEFVIGVGELNGEINYYVMAGDREHPEVINLPGRKTRLKNTEGRAELITHEQEFTGKFSIWFYGKRAYMKGSTYTLLGPDNVEQIEWNINITK